MSLFAEWRIRLYAPTNCGGALLLGTAHRTKTSFDVELSVARERKRRGEVGVIEVQQPNAWRLDDPKGGA